MQDIAQNLPEIIKAAASSNLGVVALMLIVFSGLSYGFFRKSTEIWRFSALILLFLACMSFGFAIFKSASDTPRRSEVELSKSIQSWVSEAESARSAKTLFNSTTPPSSLLDARNQFESTWKLASLVERKKQNAEELSKAFSYLNRLYRAVENDSSSQPNANFWADEAIQYFQEIQNRKLLTEALMDKAAIYLDIGQLGNNDKQQFESMARDGDAVMTKAYQIADESQRPSVLRLSSRFYYCLARPKSFILSDSWDNNYLLLAYQKAKAAYELAPADIMNANQLLRSVIRVSKNPPQDSDDNWTLKLRDSQQKLKAAWSSNQSSLVGLNERLSPLNVLGVATFETVAREWKALTFTERNSKAQDYIAEIDSDSISPLREAVALLQNAELRKSYGFDLYFDVARAEALKTVILKNISVSQAAVEFEEVRNNLLTAKENAKTSQLEAAINSIRNEITFTLLAPQEKSILINTLSVGV